MTTIEREPRTTEHLEEHEALDLKFSSDWIELETMDEVPDGTRSQLQESYATSVDGDESGWVRLFDDPVAHRLDLVRVDLHEHPAARIFLIGPHGKVIASGVRDRKLTLITATIGVLMFAAILVVAILIL